MHLLSPDAKADRSKLPSDPINGLASYEIAPVALAVGKQKFHSVIAGVSVIPITKGRCRSRRRLQAPIYAAGTSRAEARRARVAPGERLAAHLFVCGTTVGVEPDSF